MSEALHIVAHYRDAVTIPSCNHLISLLIEVSFPFWGYPLDNDQDGSLSPFDVCGPTGNSKLARIAVTKYRLNVDCTDFPTREHCPRNPNRSAPEAGSQWPLGIPGMLHRFGGSQDAGTRRYYRGWSVQHDCRELPECMSVAGVRVCGS